MKKTVIPALLVAAMSAAALLGACSSRGGTSENTVPASTTEGEVNTSAVATGDSDSGSGEEIVVTIWETQWGTENYEDTLKKLAEEATAAHIDGKNIRVEVQCIPWDNYYETFMTAYNRN